MYPREGVDVCCFMLSGKSPFIAFPVCSNVVLVSQPQLLNGFLDHLVALLSSHALCAGDKPPNSCKKVVI